MSRNSRDWAIYLPVGLGFLDDFLPLRCGDLDTAQDKMRTLPGSIYIRDIAASGRKQEIARVTDESEVGTLSLSCTEEAAGGLDSLRVIGCPFPIQRRSCIRSIVPTIFLTDSFSQANDVTAPYEHYAAVSLGERTLATPTAAGVDKNDNTPTVTFPGIFSRRFPLTDKPPNGYDFGDEIPQGIVYCYNALCGDCRRPCDKLYALVRVETEVPGVTIMVLYTSEDGGNSWAVVPNIPEIRTATAFIFCYQGSRLFIGGEDSIVYYSDDPEGEEWYESIQLNNLLNSVWVTKMVSDGYALFAIVGENQYGVVRSVDAGLTWEYVIPLGSPATGFIEDIAIAGNVVATIGENVAAVPEIRYSYRFGDWQTWVTYTNAALPKKASIGVANPNPFDQDRAWFYLMGVDTSNDIQIWKADDPEDWRLIFESEFAATIAWSFSQIYLDGDGYIGWFQACREDGATVTLRTSTGGNGFVEVSLKDTSNIGVEDTRQSVLAVCPADPDTAIIGYHSLPQEL